MQILLDNGHGNNTPGHCSPVWADGLQLQEWRYTREIAQRIEVALLAHHVQVRRIVPEAHDVPLWERCQRVNQIARAHTPANCILLSLHVNGSANGKGRGWEVHTSKGRTVSDLYATLLWKEAQKQLKGQFRMRADHTDGDPDWENNFAILANTLCPAILTENLFMDNEEECRFLLTEEGKRCIAQLHVNALCTIIALRRYYT